MQRKNKQHVVIYQHDNMYEMAKLWVGNYVVIAKFRNEDEARLYANLSNYRVRKIKTKPTKRHGTNDM